MKSISQITALSMLIASSAHAGINTPQEFLLQGSASQFKIELDGVRIDASISDVVSESAIVFDNLGNAQPGAKLNKLSLTRDWANTPEFFRWRKAVLDGKVDRRSISVIFLDRSGKEAGRMNFYNCWPSKWVGPSLNARSSGHATEKLEISWETMELKAS